MAGLARIVLYQRERPVVIEPLGKGMLLTTLRYDNTVRQPDTVFGDIKAVKTDQEMIDLAEPHHRQEEGQVRSLEIRGPLRECAARTDPAKKAGKKAPTGQAAPKPSNVVNLFDALKKSLSSDGGGRREIRRRSAKPAAQTSRAKAAQKPPPRKRKSA